jgi:3-oxoadipate enol-lactonase
MRYYGNNIKLMVNNLLVSYTDEGPDESPVLIFIHGFPLNKSMWNKQVDALKENYRVISYDIRGHGDSECGTENFSIDLFVKDLLNFMDILKIDRASLCGLSMGGYIALNAIENHPERFEALVLSDTHCIADLPEVKQKRLNTIESIKETGVQKYVDDSVKNLFAPESFATKQDEIMAVRNMILNTTEESLARTLLALSLRMETCNEMVNIGVPVLFIVGNEDKITPPAAAAFMHDKIKNSSLHIIDHAGHLSNLEQPDEFNEQLKLFFATVYNIPLNGGTVDVNLMEQLRNKLISFFSFISI